MSQLVHKIPLITYLILILNISITYAQNNSSEKIRKEKEAKKIKTELHNENLIADGASIDINDFNLNIKKLRKKALKFSDNGSYYKAIEYYKLALSKSKKDKINVLINYEMANSFFDVRYYRKAEQHFMNTIELDSKNKLQLANFYLANTLKHLEKYEEAKNTYRKFLSLTEQSKKVDFERSRSILEMKGCDFALELNTFNENFSIKNAGNNVNGVYADFGPELRENELVFSKIMDVWKENSTNHLAQIYTSEMYNDKYNFAQKFSSSINDNNTYVCNPSFTKNGEEIYFTKCEIIDNKQNHCTIFYSQLVDGVWIKPVKLPVTINEEGSNTTQPQIVMDENGRELLYFSAEREKGRGGKDIYVAEKNEDGTFSRAKNLGYPINTRYDDISPFYHTPSKTLYYSTNGKVSLGGFDIYKSVKENEEFTEPVNLTYPFNTSLDDYDFIMNDKSTLAYLVSNRKGGFTEKSETCCDDIYELKTTKIDLYVKGIIYLEKNGERKVADQSEIELFDDNGDGEKIKSDDGTFIFKLEIDKSYKIIAHSKGFDEGEILFNTKSFTKSDTLQYDLFLDNLISKKNPSILKEEVKINAFNQELIGVIYYSFSAAKLTEESPSNLEKILNYLNENPKVIIQISAHTDDVGPAEYNMQLSKERCFAAAKYLISNGIAENRIIKRWFGESQPIVPNTNEDGSDNEEGRERNRRTEFKVIGEW